jgi:5'-nucleotidase
MKTTPSSRNIVIAFGFALFATHAAALNILLVNDDGLTGNVQAQYDALVAAGHDVVVSVPCQNQSGKGAAINYLEPLWPLNKPCRGDAAAIGAPGAGPVVGKTNYWYVDGTPVMATAYGLDVIARKRWGMPPDLVISGPNEGQNAGPIVIMSGTVANAQYAASLGLSAIAVSADNNITDNTALQSEAAKLTVKLVAALKASAAGGRLLPKGVALNVNFPKFTEGQGAGLQWSAARHGSYARIGLKFVEDMSTSGAGTVALPGLVFTRNSEAPTKQQAGDEASVIAAGKVSVTAMQVGFDANTKTQRWLGRELGGLLKDGARR